LDNTVGTDEDLVADFDRVRSPCATRHATWRTYHRASRNNSSLSNADGCAGRLGIRIGRIWGLWTSQIAPKEAVGHENGATGEGDVWSACDKSSARYLIARVLGEQVSKPIICRYSLMRNLGELIDERYRFNVLSFRSFLCRALGGCHFSTGSQLLKGVCLLARSD
jgi:hypothetical protein